MEGRGAVKIAGAELWTADQRLANGAQQVGVTWVHWVDEKLVVE
jgi:hypothetical protein